MIRKQRSFDPLSTAHLTYLVMYIASRRSPKVFRASLYN
jgi:hypothetical protein